MASLYLVSGEMEREALYKHFGIKSSKINNGHKMPAATVANQVIGAIGVKGHEIDNVYIIIDRENRAETCDQLRNQLHDILSKRYPDIVFHIAIANMDTECWIFSDTDTCAKYFKKNIGKGLVIEGTNGCATIKKVIGPGRYEKMNDGVKLMGKVCWKTVEARSESARLSSIYRILHK